MRWFGVRLAFFFFSSRRRHTRLVSDWSSDVCSSALSDVALLANILHHFCPTQVTALLGRVRAVLRPGGTVAIWELEAPRSGSRAGHGDLVALFFRQIGRASCRGRVWVAVVTVGVEK